MKGQRLRMVIALGLFTAANVVVAQAVSPPTSETKSGQDASQPAPREVSRKEMKQLFVKKVRPEYPPLARQARIAGKCIIRIVIAADGSLRDAKFVSGHPLLGPSAMRAVRESKYRPYLVDGSPVEVQGEVEFDIP
jgi:periplasmic protein TonB